MWQMTFQLSNTIRVLVLHDNCLLQLVSDPPQQSLAKPLWEDAYTTKFLLHLVLFLLGHKLPKHEFSLLPLKRQSSAAIWMHWWYRLKTFCCFCFVPAHAPEHASTCNILSMVKQPTSSFSSHLSHENTVFLSQFINPCLCFPSNWKSIPPSHSCKNHTHSASELPWHIDPHWFLSLIHYICIISVYHCKCLSNMPDNWFKPTWYLCSYKFNRYEQRQTMHIDCVSVSISSCRKM